MTVEEIQLAQQVIPQHFPRLRTRTLRDHQPAHHGLQLHRLGGRRQPKLVVAGGKVLARWRALRDDSVAAFIAAFATRGYECCDSEGLEPGFDKVVLYVDEQQGRVTHAARQLSDGRWTSKLGPQWDINHLLEGVCGPAPAYGRVAQILRRPVSPPTAAS